MLQCSISMRSRSRARTAGLYARDDRLDAASTAHQEAHGRPEDFVGPALNLPRGLAQAQESCEDQEGVTRGLAAFQIGSIGGGCEVKRPAFAACGRG